MSPARAPASIDMLQRVMRPSIDKLRMTGPRYSMIEPIRKYLDSNSQGDEDRDPKHAVDHVPQDRRLADRPAEQVEGDHHHRVADRCSRTSFILCAGVRYSACRRVRPAPAHVGETAR